MNKKRKLEISPNSEVRDILKAEYPSVNLVKTRVVDRDNHKDTYVRSDPKGADYKDYMLSLKDITNLMFPKFTYTWRYYGLNFAGGHYGDDQYGGTRDTPSAAGSATATDTKACAIDDYISKAGGWCDTIAWEAGSQAWFESVFLPATWNTTTDTLEDDIKCQPSMSGIIDATNAVIQPYLLGDTLYSNSVNDTSFANKRQDYPIHYNGGFQRHSFRNNENFKVYFEAYECTPRELAPWFYRSARSGTNNRVYSRNVHDMVSADYVSVRPQYPLNVDSVAFTNGSYLPPGTGSGQIGHTTNNYANANGQQICARTDVGFKIAPWQSNTMKFFRVSKPVRGAIEPGSKFVYTLKSKPFKIMNSTWRKILRNAQDDVNPSGDDPFNNPYTNHLVPRFTKILAIRFWSDIGNNLSTDNGYEVVSTVQNPHQYNKVSYLPGRLIHTVTETHTARAMAPVYKNNHLNKDFTLLNFNETVTEQNGWSGINDETDQATQLT